MIWYLFIISIGHTVYSLTYRTNHRYTNQELDNANTCYKDFPPVSLSKKIWKLIHNRSNNAFDPYKLQ